MANRYWVGAGGNWNDTAHWSDTSGGAGGFSVPTATDDAFHDANSGGGSVVFNTTINVNNWDFTGSTQTYQNNGAMNVRGNMTMKSGGWSATGTLTLMPLSGTSVTWTTANNTLSGNVTIDAADGTGTVVLNGTYQSTQLTFRVVEGTFDTGGNTMNVGIFRSEGTAVRQIDFNNSTVTCFGSGTLTMWIISGSNLTLNADTSTIRFTSIGAGQFTFTGGGKTYNIVEIDNSPITSFTILDSNTFSVLNLPQRTPSGGRTITWHSGRTQTIGTLNSNGLSTSLLIYNTTGAGSQAFLNVTTPLVSYVNVRDNNADGGETIYDDGGFNNGNNRNWFFRTRRFGTALWLLGM